MWQFFVAKVPQHTTNVIQYERFIPTQQINPVSVLPIVSSKGL
jgi:hypothetical protein